MDIALNISASDTPSVTFELQLPEDGEMDHQQVLDLFEALQNDIEGFDDILLETVRNMETEEHEQLSDNVTAYLNEQTLNDQSDEKQNVPQPLTNHQSLNFHKYNSPL